METLYRLAESHGLTVTEGAGKHLGGYRPGDHTIRLRPGLSHRAARTVLAHEIAHHVLGHRPTQFGPVLARQERQANEWAARRLINIHDYRTAELIREGHVPSIAFDLDVLPVVVETYQTLITRARHMIAA